MAMTSWKGVTERPAEDLPLPRTRYRCMMTDPPWPMKKIMRRVRPRQTAHLDYPTMSLNEIAYKMNDAIINCAHEDGCQVYWWVTHRFL